eukprot:5443276-Amphidinium_carterae.9
MRRRRFQDRQYFVVLRHCTFVHQCIDALRSPVWQYFVIVWDIDGIDCVSGPPEGSRTPPSCSFMLDAALAQDEPEFDWNSPLSAMGCQSA